MRRSSLLLFAIAIVAVPAIASVMKMTQTTFAVPEEGEVVELTGLHYGIRFSADVNTAVYETKAGKKEQQVIMVWTFTGSNTAGKMHRVDVAVRLLNEIGERVAHGEGKATLAAGAKHQKFKVKVKTGGGEDTSHSMVLARHGLAGAFGPNRHETIML